MKQFYNPCLYLEKIKIIIFILPLQALFAHNSLSSYQTAVGVSDLYYHNFVGSSQLGDKNNLLSHLIFTSKNIQTMSYEQKVFQNNDYSASVTFLFGYGGKHQLDDYDFLWPTLDEYPSEIVDYPWQDYYDWTDYSFTKNMTLERYVDFSYTVYPEQFFLNIERRNSCLKNFLKLNFENYAISPVGSSTEFCYYSAVQRDYDKPNEFFFLFDEFSSPAVLKDSLEGIGVRSYALSLEIGAQWQCKTSVLNFYSDISFGKALHFHIDNHYSRNIIYRDYSYNVTTFKLKFIAERNLTKTTSAFFKTEFSKMWSSPENLNSIYCTETHQYHQKLSVANNYFLMKRYSLLIGIQAFAQE